MSDCLLSPRDGHLDISLLTEGSAPGYFPLSQRLALSKGQCFTPLDNHNVLHHWRQTVWVFIILRPDIIDQFQLVQFCSHLGRDRDLLLSTV